MTHTPTTGFVNVGEFFVCNCGVRLAKCVAPGVYETLKKDAGQSITITSQAVGGMVKIKCGKCGRGFNCLNIQENIYLS